MTGALCTAKKTLKTAKQEKRPNNGEYCFSRNDGQVRLFGAFLQILISGSQYQLLLMIETPQVSICHPTSTPISLPLIHTSVTGLWPAVCALNNQMSLCGLSFPCSLLLTARRHQARLVMQSCSATMQM